MPKSVSHTNQSRNAELDVRIASVAELERCVAELIQREARFAAILAMHGVPSLRTSPRSLETLLQIVTEQFLSLKAAASIWKRLELHLSPFGTDKILALNEDALMALGLSRAKARSFHGLARAVESGELEFILLSRLPGDEAHKILCKLPGIGPWSAAIFRLGALADGDAWPAGDLALQVAAQNLLELPARPNHKEMVVLAEGWRPYRAVAARLLWAHYRGLKGLGQAADSPSQN